MDQNQQREREDQEDKPKQNASNSTPERNASNRTLNGSATRGRRQGRRASESGVGIAGFVVDVLCQAPPAMLTTTSPGPPGASTTWSVAIVTDQTTAGGLVSSTDNK